MTAKLTDDERERRKLARRVALNNAKYAELLAFLAASIREHHTRDEFPDIITSLEPYQQKEFIVDLKRALYS